MIGDGTEEGTGLIIVKLLGGLGNQMFQYAAAAALARRRRDPFLLDARGLDGRPMEPAFQLADAFGIETPLASERAIRSVLGWRGQRHIRRVVAGRAGRAIRPAAFVLERTPGYSPLLEQAPRRAYLCGYWQSELYFADRADLIRSAFRFARPLTGPHLAWECEIRAATAVAVHVRRGDYATNASSRAFHGTLDPDYYARSAQVVKQMVPDARFFVFSNDIAWARENLPLGPDARFVTGGERAAPARDLQLMSLCRHHIIANSTYSWWAAWLGQHPGQTVIAPRRWFAGLDADQAGFLPRGWLTL